MDICFGRVRYGHFNFGVPSVGLLAINSVLPTLCDIDSLATCATIRHETSPARLAASGLAKTIGRFLRPYSPFLGCMADRQEQD